MGMFRFFKGNKRELEVPPAPPVSEELPSFPSMRAGSRIRTKGVKGTHPSTYYDAAEEKAVREEKAELEVREELEVKKPVFVPANSFRDMLDEINLIRNVLQENEDAVTRMAEFKGDEDKEFNKWQSQLADIQKKLIFADKTLFGKIR